MGDKIKTEQHPLLWGKGILKDYRFPHNRPKKPVEKPKD